VEFAKAREAEARAKHGDLWRSIRELDAEISSIRTITKPAWQFWKAKPDEGRLESLIKRREELREQVRTSEWKFMSTIGAMARTEKDHKMGVVAARADAASRTEEAEAKLACVARTRSLIRLCPPLAFGPLRLVFAAGHRVEAARERRLRNPWATDIWGVPL
jgi:hypothetical protein